MKLPLKKIKQIGPWVLKHLTVTSITLSLLLIVSIGIFLYKNFYLTIISAKEIIILQKDISLGSLKIDLLEKAENNYQDKLDLKLHERSETGTNMFEPNTEAAEPENTKNNPIVEPEEEVIPPTVDENTPPSDNDIAAPKTTF